MPLEGLVELAVTVVGHAVGEWLFNPSAPEKTADPVQSSSGTDHPGAGQKANKPPISQTAPSQNIYPAENRGEISATSLTPEFVETSIGLLRQKPAAEIASVPAYKDKSGYGHTVYKGPKFGEFRAS